MRLASLLVITLAFLLPLSGFAQGDKEKDKEKKEKEPEIAGKTVGEWIKILRTHEKEKYRIAALVALEYGREAHRSGATAVLDCVENDKSAAVRLQAVALIGKLKPDEFKKGAKTLIVVLKTDKADEVREAAAAALGNERYIGQAQLYANDLAEALKDSHGGTRIAVAAALRNMGEHAKPAFPVLVAAAKNPKEEVQVRVAAVHILGRHAKDDPQTLPLLLELAANTDNMASLRDIAIEGLGRSGSDTPDAANLLAKILSEKNLELRKSAAVALGGLGANAKSGWPTIKERIVDKKENSSIRNHLIRLAGALGKSNPEAVTALIAAAKEDESTENRIAAIQELGELGPLAKSAVEPLTNIAAQDARAAVREAASKALKQIRQ
jgi:HEAT repeat protein